MNNYPIGIAVGQAMSNNEPMSTEVFWVMLGILGVLAVIVWWQLR